MLQKQTWISKNDPLCEVNRYLDEPITQKTTNILTWWMYNKERFSNLSAMAWDFLAIPAS
ncbi:19324_t:CDS:1, partial [Gigaspora margarita]